MSAKPTSKSRPILTTKQIQDLVSELEARIPSNILINMLWNMRDMALAHDSHLSQLAEKDAVIERLRGSADELAKAASIFQQAAWADASLRVTTPYRHEQTKEIVSRNPNLTASGANKKLSSALTAYHAALTTNANSQEKK